MTVKIGENSAQCNSKGDVVEINGNSLICPDIK